MALAPSKNMYRSLLLEMEWTVDSLKIQVFEKFTFNVNYEFIFAIVAAMEYISMGIQTDMSVMSKYLKNKTMPGPR